MPNDNLKKGEILVTSIVGRIADLALEESLKQGNDVEVKGTGIRLTKQGFRGQGTAKDGDT